MWEANRSQEEHKLLHRVREALAQSGARSGPVLVAVSGGPDSTALLLALVEVCGVERVQAAHLNHQLRGPESDADEEFVRLIGQQLRVTLHIERRQIAQIALGTKDNLENAARKQRYAWLAELARQLGIAWVATGHTANDQAETLLFRMVRGCGLRGLRGIAATRPLTPGVRVIRPLLFVTREEVNAFLQARAITPRQDTSNLDLARSRNRIRWQLLPLLQHKYNPKVVQHLSFLAAQVDEWYAWLERQAHALLQHLELPRLGNAIVLDAHKTRQAEPVLLREALRLLWEREGWPSGKMTAQHWHRLAEFLQSGNNHLELPEHMRVHRRLHAWIIGQHARQPPPPPDS